MTFKNERNNTFEDRFKCRFDTAQSKEIVVHFPPRFDCVLIRANAYLCHPLLQMYFSSIPGILFEKLFETPQRRPKNFRTQLMERNICIPNSKFHLQYERRK